MECDAFVVGDDSELYLQLVHDHVKLFVPPLVFHIGALAAPEYVVRARVVLTQRGSASGGRGRSLLFRVSHALILTPELLLDSHRRIPMPIT